MKKEIKNKEEASIDMAVQAWFDIVFMTIQAQKEMKIKKDEKLHH
ncbi:MAG: hypothetical protein ABSC49_00520 [Candidatus Microgenomates bacterium]|jgi:hypothetical protein